MFLQTEYLFIVWFQELAFHEEERTRNEQVRFMVKGFLY